MILLNAVDASARIFNFKDTTIAAYFRATGGLHMMGQEGFSLSSGDQTFFENKDKPAYNYTGEIGLLFNFGDHLSVRLGVEGLQSREIEAPGKDGAGVPLLDVTSRILAFAPNLTFEVALAKTPESKFFLFAGMGYVTLKATNEYSMTAAGTTLYGNGNYKETVSGISLMGHGGFGYEFLFVDNCTLAIETGWRYLLANKLKYTDAITTVDGAKEKGERARNSDGSARSIDMGGPFIGVAFRFYIPPLK